VALVSAGVFLLRLSTLVVARHQESRLQADVTALAHRSGASPQAGSPASDVLIQGIVGDEARKAGVRRLLNVGGSAGPAGDTLTVEWEAKGPASFRLVERLQSRLGRCEKLDITSAEPPLLHVTTAFERRLSPAAGGAAVQISTTAFARNVFAPLWKPRPENVALAQARELKKQEDERKAEQERADQERQAREEQQQLASKQQQLETQLSLTGIVNNGHEALAFVSNRSAGGQATMLRSGDLINDARVTAIDEAKGEVALDYRGKFQVHLKISPTGTGAP
jgi:hypothetical protein